MLAKVITTDLARGTRWQETTVEMAKADCMRQVSVYPMARLQVFEGFGGAVTEAAAVSWKRLPQNQQKAFLEACFSEGGLRYTVGRTHMGSCDFALGNYTCKQAATDQAFDFSRDDDVLLPMILAAQDVAGQPLALLLSSWSPPAFMKTNGDMNHGGKLLPAFAGQWAACMAQYAAHYRDAGCNVRWMSVQNEPAAVQTWDSCIYTAKEEGEFAARHLAPALKAVGMDTIDILAWDHNKEALMWRAAETLSVEGAQEAVAGFALHWYTGDHFEALRLFRELWPSRSLLFTEGCVEYGRFGGVSPLQKAEMYAHDILGNLNGGISASIDWNLLLDAKGGPNHAGNFCEAPLMLNAQADAFEAKAEYDYIGQFSRYIRPGDTCIGASAYAAEIEVTAFARREGGYTVVLLNRTDAGHRVSITSDAENAVNLELPAHTICTVLF